MFHMNCLCLHPELQSHTNNIPTTHAGAAVTMLGRSCFRKALVWSAATLVVVGGLSDPCPSHGSNAHRISHHSSNNEEKVQGFLPEKYNIQGGRHLCKHVAMQIRQVPGDGNCLFHAISACLEYVVNGTHPRCVRRELYRLENLDEIPCSIEPLVGICSSLGLGLGLEMYIISHLYLFAPLFVCYYISLKLK